VRTAISIVGFGILIDKIDPGNSGNDPLVGALLIGSGGLLIAFAALRFTTLNRRINSAQAEAASGLRFKLVFLMMNSALALLLVVFVVHIS
jgi:uncharacterized membrane protein YidH (DUF202 family)